jgi:outer membrane protease
MRIVSLFAVFVIILFCAQPIQAQLNKDYAFSLCPQFGFFYGHVEEMVYPPPENKADLLSLLLWDIKPVIYYGFLMDFSPVKPMERWSFFSGLSMKYGIPGPSGVMEDKDWLLPEYGGITNYSTHDNITKEIFLLDFSTGFSFPIRNIFLIKSFVNISYMLFRFSGENGYGIYALSTPPQYSFSGMGTVISYRQEWFCAAPGISVGYGYDGNLSAELSFIITPIVFCADLDEHKGRNIQFRENMTGGVMLEPGLRLFLDLSKRLGISCDISWRYISGVRGLTYRRPIGIGNYIQDGEAGAGLSILNTALLLKVKL